MDFFFSPMEGAAVRIQPGQSVLLETGVKMEVPPGCMLQIMNKSGVASKLHLITGACVVDEGYTGEIFVRLKKTIFTATQQPGAMVLSAQQGTNNE